MNIDNSSSVQKVTSKYFSRKSGMDESLSDFQEKKKFSAPKSTKLKQKATSSINKKTLKKHKGQRDIRTALKSKKSELVAYSKDFDNVCKQAGIDVDSEQLQLAIALSKSIQSSTSNSQSSVPSSLERSAKIRCTLQEYGFTVPEIKISNASRKTKKHKKDYKLLLTSETEKQQNIADRFSQVLLQNISFPRSPTKRVEIYNCDPNLYYLSTNVPYEPIRDNNLFYLENLPLEKSLHKGTLLRDWSEIPGRPVSPKLREDFTMDVSEILCSQEELNIVLSGALKNAKNIIKSKLRVSKKIDVEIVEVDEKCFDETATAKNKFNDKDTEKSLSARGLSNTRSCSPDIFDDEQSLLHDLETSTNKEFAVDIQNKPVTTSVILPGCLQTANSILSSQGQLSQRLNITRRKSNDVMELTECVGVMLNPSSTCTAKTDITNRKSNDFMELTECVAKPQEFIEDNIDLTQNLEEKQIDNVDLTQSSNSNDTLTFVHVSGKNDYLDNTVILNKSEISHVNRSPAKGLLERTTVNDNADILCDLTPEKLPKKIINVEENSSNDSFEDFLYNHSNSPEQNGDLNNYVSCANIESDIDLTQSPEENDTIDLSNKDSDKSIQNSSTSKNAYMFPERAKFCNNSNLGKKNDVSIDYDELSTSHKTDLYDLSAHKDSKGVDHNSCSMVKFSKSNNSITHSETLDTSQESEVFEISDKELDYSVHKSRYEDFEVNFGGVSIIDINNISNGNNSMKNYIDNNKSTKDSLLPEVNFENHNLFKTVCSSDPGPSTIYTNIIKNNDNNETTNNFQEFNDDHNKSTNVTLLPEVNFKNHDIPNTSYGLSPIKPNDMDNINTSNSFQGVCNESNELPKDSSIKNHAMYDIVKTPSNNEYIIKADQLTPMGDFASMSTPDRNKELDKYGLKPLKRKRAIKLLTYIYNQTHPIVEPCTSELSQSPTKKRKTEHITSSKSPKKNLEEHSRNIKQVSPTKRKNVISPMKKLDVNHEIKENIYEVTNTIEIKNLECAYNDWVFQKREKSKIHSSRVPLHIAFHNYISCRQGLREAILRYEPVEIDVIHKDLMASGHRYDPKDLLKFLDKKCITVKTTDNNARNNRK